MLNTLFYALQASASDTHALGGIHQQASGRKTLTAVTESFYSGIVLVSLLAIICSVPARVNAATISTGSAVTLKNASTGLCVDTGGSTGFTYLVQEKCSGAASQNFAVQSSPVTGDYYIESSSSGMCWDVSAGSRSAGAHIQQYSCVTSTAEYFQLSSVGTGTYNILSVNMTNGCIDLAGSTAGSAIEQNTCNGSASQVFQMAAPSGVSVSVSPTSAALTSGKTQQFMATVTGSTNTAVTWSTTAGSISTSGLLTAPTCTSNMSVTVTATSQASTSASASATVTVTPSGAVAVSISPTNPTISSGGTQQFTASVTGSTNTTVTWSTTDGSISTSGLYTAPSVSSNTTATVTATSEASSSKTASAAITIDATTSSGGLNPKNYGATGNGTTDDTAAIQKAISALTSGASLVFPCGTYLTSSALTINISNVTVNGSSCATIHDTGSGTIMYVGGSGGNPSYGSAITLSATANELATSFTTDSSLGVSAGGYLLLQQGGEDSSTGSGNTGCDTSGCRGELVQVASVSGNTVAVTTALHDTYNPSVNAATAQKVNNPLTGLTIENITLDGNGSNTYGLAVAGVVNSTLSGVTVQNVQGAALLNRGDFNVTWSNITVSGAGSEDCGAAAWFQAQGNLQVNGLTIQNENTASSNCLGDGAFGFEMVQSANGTLTNVTVNASGAGGRPWKTTAARWNTFNSATVENSAGAGFNGISLEYYSSHNTYNNCVVTNTGGSGTGDGNGGINTFGNFNQYNTFSNCTISGNGNVQVLVNNFDDLRLGQDIGNTFSGGTITGSNSSEAVFNINGANTYITAAHINGPGGQGILLGTSNACINSNVFGSGLSTGISSDSSSNIGSGNVMNGASSNLASGTCTGH